jgi:tRNA modification GTPase
MAGDTIYALSSGQGRAAVAVLRLSGPDALTAAAALAGPLSEPRRASLRTLRDPRSGAALDRAIVIAFPAPASFTGEDAAELHVHGGRAVVRAVGAALEALGLRPAEPGEFTRRAFVAGRLDLTEVEGLADLIDADTEAQRRAALAAVRGEHRVRTEGWRDRLVAAMCLLEAMIDFADEDDAPDDTRAEVATQARALAAEIAAALASAGSAERLRDGVQVVIAGPPNAGKSTLLNALARRDVAIVADEPGTTRDIVEVALDIGGLPFSVSDTAGLREAAAGVEREGVRRAEARMKAADLVLWLEPPEGAEPPDGAAEVWRLAGKADLGEGGRFGLPVSGQTGAGIDILLERLHSFGAERLGGEDRVIMGARERRHLAEAEAELRAAADLVHAAPELAAERLRLAARALDSVVGRVHVEDLLGSIFARFCIGK